MKQTPQRQSSLSEMEELPPGPMVLESLPTFPHSLFQFKAYDGAKAITALFLSLSTLYLLAGFVGFLVDNTSWLHDWLVKPPTTLPSHPSFWKTLWHPIGSTLHYLGSYVDLAVRMFVFICTYCLAWATFDPRNIEGSILFLISFP